MDEDTFFMVILLTDSIHHLSCWWLIFVGRFS